MPEFKELDSKEVPTQPSDSAAEAGQTVDTGAKGMARSRTQRRRNPISSKAAKPAEPAKPIGPFEMGSKETVKLASNERCCGEACQKGDRRYSTEVVAVAEPKTERGQRQFRRKENEACGPRCAQKIEGKTKNCKCCSFLKRVLKKVWPFGKKEKCERDGRQARSVSRHEGDGRRRRSSGSQNRRGRRFSNDSSHQR